MWNIKFHIYCIYISMRSGVTFHYMLIFYCEELLAPHPIPKPEEHPLLAAHNYLFNIFAATLKINRPSPAPTTCRCTRLWWQGPNTSSLHTVKCDITSQWNILQLTTPNTYLYNWEYMNKIKTLYLMWLNMMGALHFRQHSNNFFC